MALSMNNQNRLKINHVLGLLQKTVLQKKFNDYFQKDLKARKRRQKEKEASLNRQL